MAWIFVNQTKFYLHDDETLLDGLIRQGYKPAYQCGEGYCGTCKLKRQDKDDFSAQVDFIHEPLLMLEKHDILPCSCLIKGVLHIEMAYIPEPIQNTDTQAFSCFDPDDPYGDRVFNS